MPPLMYQLAGGTFFVPAALLLALVLLAKCFVRRRWFSFLLIIVAMLAIAVIAVSATALPWWFYAGWTLSILVWFFVGRLKSRRLQISVGTAAFIFTATAATLDLL